METALEESDLFMSGNIHFNGKHIFYTPLDAGNNVVGQVSLRTFPVEAERTTQSGPVFHLTPSWVPRGLKFPS
ncbi:hypothetical protein ZHAS_00004684 [Anopheles sinensis]|uniref:Uncharacterized protein n=1 Tax=Anopheles sinensis TaxID=74873 RepID=A0A084VHE2_ANOSI|nr:hypothetical protein ZHAS_00004684 [Anopheles sinensis]